MFKHLVPWLNIVLTSFIGVVVVYLLLFITSLGFALFFKRALKQHNKSMNVILMTKYDNILTSINILKKMSFPLDEKILKTISEIDVHTFVRQDTIESKIARDELTYLRSELTYICRINPEVELNNDFLIAKENIYEMDIVYRNAVAMYNADVLGYNYWIRFMPCRWIYLFFKIKKKELI